jgi:hypothetical protein
VLGCEKRREREQGIAMKEDTVQKNLNEEIRKLDDSVDADGLRLTRERLERVNYSPILILPVPGFLSFSKDDVLREIERVAGLSDREMQDAGLEAGSDFAEMKARHIELLVYHFKLLVRLRRDEPEAWDEVDEIFGDD